MTIRTAIRTCAAILLALSCASAATAAEPADPARSGPLYEQVEALDRALFAAFNAEDLEGLMAGFSDDLEFYHDKDGALDRAQVQQAFGTMFERHQHIQRTPVPGTREVYPLGKDGAIERGAHRFCHEENGKPDCGTFQYVSVWRKQGEQWKLARALSFGH
jgi:ketosteroid isomerase-like protein